MIDQNTQSQGEDLVGPIIESFLERFRKGERPALADLIARYPDLAEELQEIIPALVNLEHLGGATGSFSGSPPSAGRLIETNHPERLGDYLILRRIGGGGMGVVYEAEHESLKSRVALKVMHPRFRSDEKYLRRFHIEARSAAGLHHTNIVSVFDYGEQDGVFYYAMQYIRGQPLDAVLEDLIRLRAAAPDREKSNSADELGFDSPSTDRATRSVAQSLLLGQFATKASPESSTTKTSSSQASSTSPTPNPEVENPAEPSSFTNSSLGGSVEGRYYREVARVGAQVAEALAYAHRAGVLHRDIKPSNLILDALGNVWVTDFGLAKFEGGEDASQSQDLVGTLRYMAPERFKGISNRSGDLYALGATLYELVTLKPAFDGTDQLRLIHRVVNDPPISPRVIDPRVPRDLATIVMKTLSKDPKDRFGSAHELAEELRKFVDGLPIRSRPISTAERWWRWCRRNPWLAAASVAAVVTTLTLAIGSAVAAKVYYDDREKIATSERETRAKLFEAKLLQARASRTSRRVGQRFDGLSAISEAVKIGRDLGYSHDQFAPLRDEAIACMALSDAKIEGRPIPRIKGSQFFTNDQALTRCADRLESGLIVIHRISDNQEIARFVLSRDSPKEFWVYTFSPDGRYFMSSDGPDRKLIVWDVDRGKVCLIDPGPISEQAAYFSPNSRQVTIARDDKSFVTYDLASATIIRRWQDSSPPRLISFSPDGRLIAAVYGGGGLCRIMSAETGKQILTFSVQTAEPGHPAWSPDGQTLAIPTELEKVNLWSASTGEQLTSVQPKNGGLITTFHPSGDLLATNGWESRLRVWDPISRQQLFSWNDYHDGYLMIGKEGQIIQSSEADRKLYRISQSNEYRRLTHQFGEKLGYHSSSFSPDGRIVAAATSQGILLWEQTTGIELAFLTVGRTWGCQFEPGGDLLVSGNAGTLRWPISRDPVSGKTKIGPPRELPIPGSDCELSIDREGKIIAVPRHTEAIVSVGEKVILIGGMDDCRFASVSPDGEWLATGEFTRGGASIWKIPEKKLVAKLPIEGRAFSRFSPDGRWLITSFISSTLWEAGTWREIRKIQGEFRGFSPDGRITVFQLANKELVLVETESGRTLARLIAQDDYDTELVSFSPDGSKLAVPANEPPCVHIWDLRAIRRNLKEMGLDWDAPPLPEADDSKAKLPSLTPFTVDYGLFKDHVEQNLKTPNDLLALNTKRIKDDPNDYNAYHGRGHANEGLRRTREAFEDFSKAIALHPDDAMLLECRARLQARSSATMELAINDLEAALKIDPTRRRVRGLLAGCCNDLAWKIASAPQRALRLSARAVELAPDQQIYLNTHGVILYRAGRLDESLLTLDKSLAAGQGLYDGYDLFFLAMVHHRLGHREEARRCLDRAIEWTKTKTSLTAEETREVADFRAEAEGVLAGPASELPEDVFAHPESLK